MEEQVNLDEVITAIMYGLSSLISEQERLNQARMVLYMNLHNMRILREETGISTVLDNTGAWVDRYLMSLTVKGCTQASVNAYRQEFKQFFSLVDKNVTDVTRGDIQGYLAYCKLRRGNCDQTINNKIRMLRGLFTWLAEEEYLERNPMTRIRENKVEHKVKEVFTDEQITVIKDTAFKENLRDLAIVDFLHSTGVRISEMVALNRSDIDLPERRCIVYGKGRKERPVYFNGEASVHLKKYLESRTDHNPALFVSLKAPYERLSDSGVRLRLKRLCEKDERLKGIANNPHKWRRQFVTGLLEKDVPLEIVADLAGHNNLNTTKDNYANYSQSKARDAHRKYVS